MFILISGQVFLEFFQFSKISRVENNIYLVYYI